MIMIEASYLTLALKKEDSKAYNKTNIQTICRENQYICEGRPYDSECGAVDAFGVDVGVCAMKAVDMIFV